MKILFNYFKGRVPLGGIFRAERNFLLFKDQLAESGRRKTKEIILIPPDGKNNIELETQLHNKFQIQ